MAEIEERSEIPAQLLDKKPADTAEEVGLRYVSDDQPGYRRKRWGRGFTYLDPAGEHVQDVECRARFENLVIPPAWTDVWICRIPEGHIQATGRDAQGRKQYIYHSRWEAVRNRTKFERLLPFATVLPEIRAQVNRDLRQRRLTHNKIVAIVVYLLQETLIRIGNRQYARKNETFGLTTFRDRHLTISGSRLHFSFTGKSGKQQQFDLKDRRLARLVKRTQELPGQKLFQYVDETGELQPIDSSDINRYLKKITGYNFTAKEFRTWGGTVTALTELYSLGPGETEPESQANVVEAVKQVAEMLGNTPAVSRQYYIHPAVIDAYHNQSLFHIVQQEAATDTKNAPHELNIEEKAAVRIIKQQLKQPV